MYGESRHEEGKAETRVEDADKNLETCRKALEYAEIEAKNAHDELIEKKKWRRKVQKRTLFMTSVEMKKDNSDNENEGENGDQNSEERNVAIRETCTVCFEIYGEGDRQK